MAYSEGLASRIRAVLADRPADQPPDQPTVREQKMFGGLCFMVGGHMCCGVVGEELMLRVGPAQQDQLLGEPHARLMDFTGKPMKGMLYVGAGGIANDADLAKWVGHGVAFVNTLPPK